ncbi:MAG: hypothetical protein MUD01_00185 [Chloroflexaceae bacterium]|jgi:capsular polysaccharide biosynthesis protein|nr:hypothetical protein [Chloroflexaceae bacterium]
MVPRVTLRLLESYFRHRWLHLLPLCIMALAAVAYLASPVYISHASIYVRKETLLDTLNQVRQLRDEGLVGGGTLQVSTPALSTVNEFKELVGTEAFVRAVIDQTDLRTRMTMGPREVDRTIRLYRESFFVETEGDNLVRFYVEAETPELAYQMASATATSYRAWKISRDVQEGTAATDFFSEVVKPYEQDLVNARKALEDYLAVRPAPVVGDRPVEEELQIKQYNDAIDLANERLRSILAREESARLALSQTERDVDQTYVVVDSPRVPERAETLLDRWMYPTVFLSVGLLLSILSAVMLLVLDKSFRVAADVVQELELPVLAQVARSNPNETQQRVTQLISTPKPSASSEQQAAPGRASA